MKFKTRVTRDTKEITIDGRTETVPVEKVEKIPLIPRDWDTLTTYAAFALVGVLTMVAIVWSTISIGSLLGGGVGFMAAILFDISWAVCLILEWKARFDSTKRKFPRNLGWALLLVTMFFIGWHGAAQDNIPLAVVGSAVSLFAKVLWLAIMRFVDRELTPDHQAWVNAVISKSNAQLAVAEVLRQVAMADDRAVALKLAIEHNRTGIVGIEQVANSSRTNDHLFANSSDEQFEQLAEQPNTSVLTGPNTRSNSSNSSPSMAERVRELLEQGATKDLILNTIVTERPDVNRSSLEASIRRQIAKKNGSV